MSVLRLIVALVILAYGLIVGALNTQPIQLKLLFADIQTSSGVGILLSLLLGTVVGALLVFAAVVWPLYAKLRKVNKQVAAGASASLPGN